MLILENTGNYMAATDRIGYAIKNVGTRKEVYLQGDDAMEFRRRLDWADAAAKDQADRDAKVDMVCEEYEPVMT